jgi:CubicO group peptidase (beta-lactamase class C family)
MADFDHGIDNTPETVFHCASLAKQFTAMSILLLSDEIETGKRVMGKRVIKLDDDVSDYIPELKIPGITIRHLLHHTSGVRDMLIQLTLAGWRWGDDAMSAKDVLDLVSRMQTPNFTPGSRFAYSNTNYFLAGEIVSRVSREKSLADFAQKHIFARLGMESTRFVNTYCQIVENRAYGYRSSERVSGPPFFEKRIPNYDLTGPTNLFTTVDDLLRWDANFDSPSPSVGGKSAIAALQRPTQQSNGYGLGLFVLRDTNGTVFKVHHNGRTIGYRTHLVHDYEHGISIALLCNVEFTNVEATKNITDEVSQIVQGKEPNKPALDEPELEIPPGTKSPEALEEYCGTYHSSEIDTAYKVQRDETGLVIKRPGHPDATLMDFPDFPDDTFVARGFTEVLREVEVTFRRDKDRKNNITELTLDWARRIGGSRLMDFKFVKVD